MTAFPWPSAINGGRRLVGTFSPCVDCPVAEVEWTWISYADSALCLRHARARAGLATPVPEVDFRVLDDDEARCLSFAEKVYARKRRHNVKVGRQDDLELNAMGKRGEVAFSYFTGLPVDWSISRRGDRGVDFVSTHGTIDVKTHLWGYDLNPDVPGSRLCADLLVMAWCRREDRRLIRLVGYVSTKTFNRNFKWRDFGHGARRTLASAFLFPMAGLKA